MALLNLVNRKTDNRKRVLFKIVFAITLLYSVLLSRVLPATVQEYQIKAVFLFYFSQFVDWPVGVFPNAQTPFRICVIGQDPFGSYLDETVKGEKVKNRSFIVERYSRADEIKNCQVLFVSRSENTRLQQILQTVRGKNVLTVSDMEGFVNSGGIIRFVLENNKVRFRINLDAAKKENLIISSKLLRPADVVSGSSD